jgi:integrase
MYTRPLAAAGHLIDGTRIVGPTKSEAGRRRVALPVDLVDEVRAHLDQYVAPDRDALVFHTPTGLPLRGPNFHHVWARARKVAGEQFPPRDSTGCTFTTCAIPGTQMAAMTGASTRELMVRMGHSTPRAALIYQHATSDRDKAIAAALGDMISQARPAVPGMVPSAQLGL